MDNRSGLSAGIRGNGFKASGTLTVLELDKNGKVQFDREKFGKSLAEFLAGPAGKDMAGFTGGIQGGLGTLGGMPYAVGSTLDLMHEAYPGPHDFIGGTLTGFYDNQGNARQGQTKTEKMVYGVLSGVALVPATPFALSEALPPSVWKTFDIVLGLLR